MGIFTDSDIWREIKIFTKKFLQEMADINYSFYIWEYFIDFDIWREIKNIR